MNIKQHDVTDCGAACLVSIAGYYKLNLSIAKIRQYANTNRIGTTLLGLIEAATTIGFEAKGVKGTADNLDKIPLPAIAHVIVNENRHHYVVIYKVRHKYLWIMDPAEGKMRRSTIDDFLKGWTNILILLLPSKAFKRNDEEQSHLSWALKLIEPHKEILLQTLFGAFIYTFLGLSTAIFVQKITDYVLVDDNVGLLNMMGIIMLVVLILQLCIGTAKSIFTLKVGQQIDAHLILGYCKHLLSLPQAFFDTMRIGEIISRLNDAVKIRTFINDIFIGLAINIFIISCALALMFTYYWKLAIIALTVIPLYIVIYIVVNTFNRKVQRKFMEESALLETQLVESLSTISTIKGLGLESFTNLKTENYFVQLLKTIYAAGKISVFSNISIELVSQLLTICILWKGAGYVLNSQITPGELFSFYALIGYFTGPVASLIGANKGIQDAIIASDRLFEIMDLEIEKNSSNLTLTPSLIGDIRFEDVSFRYGSRTDIFCNLNLKIKAGSFTAIVGESGSGKSTLMALLQNIYPIQNGEIYIGKYAINCLTNTSLRKLISVVPQKIDLFAGNVIDNITIGDNEPKMQRVIDICRQLGIIKFIEALPQGFQTYLGENGATLSGGQKQRIAIARALYRDPEILILDEATSSLDLTAENYVQRAISVLVKHKKTIIVIAHRLTIVSKADHIIVLDKGRVVEEGRHELMLETKGHYANLWQQQFGSI